MAIQFNNRLGSGGCGGSACVSKDGCPSDRCPDFVIRRHDTKPFFKVSVEDCDGPMDIKGMVVEASMWALAKLKARITPLDDYFQLADGIGFDQIMIGDIIAMDRVRSPEYMLVTGFDEENKYIQVQRAYRNTTAGTWARGSKMRIFRVLNAPAQTELVYEDIQEVDGTTNEDVLTEAYLIYEWEPEDTCLPGCYWLEFKLLKMIDVVLFLPGGQWDGEVHTHTDGFFYTGTSHSDASAKLSYDAVEDVYNIPSGKWDGEVHLWSGLYFTGTSHDDGSVYLNRTGVPEEDAVYDDTGKLSLAASVTPSFTGEDSTPADFGCILGEGVEWVRRFPVAGEGFLIKIVDSPTTELL